MEKDIAKKLARKYNKREALIHILLVTNNYNIELIKRFFEVMQ